MRLPIRRLLPASIPVKIARGKHATLYRLPVRFAGVTSIPGATDINALPELTTTRREAPGAAQAASGRGYTPLHADFPRLFNR